MSLSDIFYGIINFNLLYLLALIVGILILIGIFNLIEAITDKLYEIFPNLKNIIEKITKWVGIGLIVLTVAGLLLTLYLVYYEKI